MKNKNHAKLICDVGEITDLFEDTPSLDACLQKIVVMVSEHMMSDVCSIYLFYEDKEELVLKATKGLHPDSIGQVKMKPGEGLTGLSLKELRPIREAQAQESPNFRYFPGIGEEKYESFLAVPILRGIRRIGVMVVQSQKKDYFTDEDIQVLRAITAQLATTIETAKLLASFNEQKKVKEISDPATFDLKFIQGKVGAEGAACSETVVLDGQHLSFEFDTALLQKKLSEKDFFEAVMVTERQLESLQEQIEETMYDVASLIFTAQILMLKDKGFIEAMVRQIKDGKSPALAVRDVVRMYIEKFSGIPDPYLREKTHDVKDVGKRLLENLVGINQNSQDFEGKCLIATELLPSDALKLFSQRAKGIILLTGGATSHLAILSRSLNMPMIICDEPKLLGIPPDAVVLMDARVGNIYINPTDEIISKVEDREDVRKNIEGLRKSVSKNPQTKDGTKVELMANINLIGDLKAAQEFEAQGVGLYRTEFPFLVRSDFPSEQEQFLIYQRIVEGMPDKEVTFRTLDIGGDKLLSYYDYGKEANPFLGLRSIRFSLKHKDIFAQQIRAMLRAGHKQNMRILFPMISSVEEFLEAKAIVQECQKQLKKDGKDYMANPPLGVMVELPSALEILEDLGQEADFFSIGTNDLIQYLLAVDRTNQKVADLYMPSHPAVLRALKKIVMAATKYKKDVSICGDMAHDPLFVPFLLGIGIRKFSLDARYLPQMHELVRGITLADAKKFSVLLLNENRTSNITKVLKHRQTSQNPIAFETI